MKIALAMIAKNTDEEITLVNRCLENVEQYVDGIFLTLTAKKGEQQIIDTALDIYPGKSHLSYFDWINDFSAARNFNFSQVPKDYDYILWCDADDQFRGLEKLRKIIEENSQVDAFAFWYLYEFDEYKMPIVVHKKTQVVRNDNCTSWVGKLHEDFKENRALNVKFVEGIERMHFTDEKRSEESKQRNVQISQAEAKENPDDPKVYFNLGNSLFGAGKAKRAKTAYQKFIETSGSEDEKYVAYQRLSTVDYSLGNREGAIEHLQIAVGMFPELPDAYYALGYLYFNLNMMDQAEKYFLLGLVIKPKLHKVIVYNPRDYDYNPMMALAKVYFRKNRPDLALPMLKGCFTIYPESEYLKGLVSEMEKETGRLNRVVETIKHIETLGGDKEKILYAIEKLPHDLQSHPAISRIRNLHFIKEESSGKDIAYFCGQTTHIWNPEMAKTKGIGGSEEAVINLSKEWAKAGYTVTVFNSCGEEPMVSEGVTYKPWWQYNHRDKYDYTILWRTPVLADHDLNTTRLFVDLHDVLPAGEFNEKRLKKIDKIFVKTKAHRALFPNIPDEKFAIIPNGQDPNLFAGEIKKNPKLLVNTSSPDRSMDVLPKLFKEVKKQVPEARLKWAYGWEIFDNTFSKDKDKMAWRNKIEKEMEEAGIENLGRLSQAECAKLYEEGAILAYPSEFYEIDCISVKKAQACGCVPVTTDFAAFAESNRYGVRIHSKKTKENWSRPYQFTFGIEDPALQEKWVEAVVKELKTPTDTEEMKVWAACFEWDLIASRWSSLWQ